MDHAANCFFPGHEASERQDEEEALCMENKMRSENKK